MDTLVGLGGNDTYVVSNVGDVVVEAAGGGTDTVGRPWASYTLGANLENLTYTGAGSFVGTGNSLANVITGGVGNDTLDGGANAAGVDTLIGGTGNDTYVVNNAGDVVTEAAGAGTDTEKTALASLTLAANVENLTYTGAGAFAGTGNTLANVITGGAGNDTLNGGANANGGGHADRRRRRRHLRRGQHRRRGDRGRRRRHRHGPHGAGELHAGRQRGEPDLHRGRRLLGTGNSLANVITGGAGADTLTDGTNTAGIGVDTLIGGAGDDTYNVSTRAT